MENLKDYDIKSLHSAYITGELKVHDVVYSYINNIKQKDGEIHAFLELFTDIDLYITKAQEMIDSGNSNFLTGIPIAIKDNMLWSGHNVSAGSKMLAGYVASYTSPVVTELLNQGVVIVGRTNMDEFAMGSSTENSAYGPTKNPIDQSYVPGGSSGGSAAAVAMNGVVFSIGSDTGGSIRQPAAFCGLVGLKPTYGAVSRYGLIAMSSSLDEIGPFTKTVADSKLVFDVLNYYDKNDATLISKQKQQDSKKDFKKVIGIPIDFIKEGVDPEIMQTFNETVEKLKQIGYTIKNIKLPLTPLSLAVYYIIQPAEVSSNLARFDGVRYGYNSPNEFKDLTDFYKNNRSNGFGREVRRRSVLGAYILSHGYYDAYYNKARLLQNAIKQEFVDAFEDIDAVLLPTTPTTPFKFGDKSESPLAMYLADLFTAPANIAGLPAISVPVKNPESIFPVGIQIVAPHFNEEFLFTIGEDIEKLYN